MTHTITAIHAKSFFQKTKGLILENEIKPMFFFTRFGIHTFGLKEAIDVLILDSNHKIVKLKTVSRNTIFLWSPRFNNVLELPDGSIYKKKIRLGDHVALKFT